MSISRPSLRTSLLLSSALLLLLAGACHTRLPLDRPKAEKEADDALTADIETYPWPEYVTGEERNKIDEALHTIWDVGGRDARDAEAYLVGLDKDADAAHFRAAGRLVTEMKNVLDQYGVQEYEGKSRIMVLDRILRKIDGVQERFLGNMMGLDIDDPPAKAMRLIRAWNWWYRKGRFLARYTPWDPRVDGVDVTDDNQPLPDPTEDAGGH